MTTPNYRGKMLIASPSITSVIFQKTVIYIHTDDETGSIGLMSNSPMSYDQAVKWSDFLDWNYPDKIYHGGPVEQELGFVVHSNDYSHNTTVELNEDLRYTGGKIVVHDINNNRGPDEFILYTGYCSWNPGQLDTEVKNNMWIVADFDKDYFFKDLDREHGWEFSINVAAQNMTTKLLDTVDITDN